MMIYWTYTWDLVQALESAFPASCKTHNSIKHQIIECIAQVKDIQQVHNELKEKLQTLEDRSQRDNVRVDGIQNYEEESWDNAGLLHNIMTTTGVYIT